MKKWHKTTLVVIGAVVFSTVAIQASDMLRNIDTKLTGLVIESSGPCGEGAVLINLGSGPLCVDIYEASANGECPVKSPDTQTETQENINAYECTATSKQSVTPWRYVSLSQAQQLCARSGKRLPTNDEWYGIAVSMGTQEGCVTDSQNPSVTGSGQCVTQSGVYDMVGNLWEWIDAEVFDGQYNQRPLPESGYVYVVDSNGVVIETSPEAVEEYGDDYATTKLTGVRGVLRGGFYGSGEDAGIYAQNISASLDSKLPGVGFRCVRSI